VEVDESYTLHPDKTKKDRLIQAIAWWSQEQMRLARRFVSRRLVESDATFNTNERRLLLQHVVGIDNTGKTFPILQVFHISESARTFRFIMDIWRTYFFYDCPGIKPSTISRRAQICSRSRWLKALEIRPPRTLGRTSSASAVDAPGTPISTALTVGCSICRNATSPPPTRPSLANTDADCRKSRHIGEWQ
jgi:hypothetical protein